MDQIMPEIHGATLYYIQVPHKERMMKRVLLRALPTACLLLLLGGTSQAWAETKSVPPNWPTNPYWVNTPAPKGPGHKVGNWSELLEKAGDPSNIGIKVGKYLVNHQTGEIGTYRVGDELKVGACIGVKNKRFALNHKGGHGGGLENATLVWMSADGKTELERHQLKGGCG